MRQTTLAIILRGDDSQLLLCMKKRGFGQGKWNGPGGKCLPDEAPAYCITREIHEEIGVQISPAFATMVGVLHFYYAAHPEWDQDVHLFMFRDYEGEVTESDEVRPEWFSVDAIPYDSMWEDDAIWLPRVLKGESVHYTFRFGMDGSIDTYDILQ